MIRITVIIPCLNSSATIGTQLEALANQQWFVPWEVIVSDNGSTDGTLALVEQYQKRIPQLRIVDSSDRRGAGHARNVGLRNALGQAFLFCDADDEVASGWLAAAGAALLSGKDFIACQIEDEKLNKPHVKAIWNPSRTGPRPFLGYLPAVPSWGMGFTRSLYETVGEFDESFLRLQDIDYSWRAQLAGIKLHFVPGAVVHYHYRHSLFGLFRQAYLDGQYHVALYKRYGHLGMPWPSTNEVLLTWKSILRGIPGLRKRDRRGKWIFKFGVQLGRLEGLIQYRNGEIKPYQLKQLNHLVIW